MSVFCDTYPQANGKHTANKNTELNEIPLIKGYGPRL